MVEYIKAKTKFEMISHSSSLALSARSDVREFFNHCIKSKLEISNMVDDLLLSKGLFIRAPYIPIPEQVEFVKKQSFLSGFFGDKRPINTREIGCLYFNIQTNSLSKSLLMGFNQVVKDKKAQAFIVRGREIADKHMQILSELIAKKDLPAPMSWDSEILDSTDSPFSDELMMFHTVALNSYGLGFYGLSLSTAFRRDISQVYVRLRAEIGQYLDDGAKLMIDNNWLEKVPEAPKRKEITSV